MILSEVSPCGGPMIPFPLLYPKVAIFVEAFWPR